MTEERPPRPPETFADEQRRLGVGVRLQRRPLVQRRHAPAIEASVRALLEPGERLLGERLEKLRLRLWRSPGWVARLVAAGVSPDDLRSTSDLRHFPVLERDDYARGWTELFDLDGDPELHVATSSGSTGQALLVARSGYDGVHMWAVVRFWAARLGIELPPRPRLVLLCALPGGLEYSARAPLLHDGALHRISTIRPRARERLLRVGPAVLSSDPAGLHWLLGGEAPRPRLVLSSAMTLAPSLRASATAALGAPVVNYYASTETGPIAWECLVEAGRWHVLHPDVHVESVAGQLDVTRLRDSPLPLLRYRTGDRGDVIDGACACGVSGRSIVGFGGRQPCPFRLPDGREVDAWSLSWLFKDLPLARFELAQIGPRSFTLVLDVGVTFDLALLAGRVERALIRLGFEDPTVAASRAAWPLPAKPRPFVCRL